MRDITFCDFSHQRARRSLRRSSAVLVAASMIFSTIACSRSTAQQSGAEAVSQHFAKCGLVRRTCVVDGDTFWLDGRKIRVADIDTPEIGKPKCDAEYALGMRATQRFIELLNAGTFTLQTIGSRDTDRYGRELRVVIRNGHSLGDELVGAGLARTWTGRREPWC